MPTPLPTARELSYALFGAYRFARLDGDAMQYFDTSIDGFWKSFWAAAIVAPAFLIMIVFSLAQSGPPTRVGLVGIAVVEIARYVMAWVAFPLAMITVSETLQRGERYMGFIVAYNWAQVVEAAVVLPVFLLNAASGQTGAGPDTANVIVFLLVIAYEWFIARTALQISGWAAGAVVALAVAIEYFILRSADALLA